MGIFLGFWAIVLVSVFSAVMGNFFGFWTIVSVSAIVLVSVFSAVKGRLSPRSQQTGVSPSLGDVKDQLNAVKDESDVDELIKIIRDLLQWRIAGESVEDKAESSQSVASRLIGSGEAMFKFLNDHAEKSSNKGDIVNSAPQIIEDVLDKLRNVHWLVAGLSVIGYMLYTADEMSENCKRCLDRLQRLVDLSDHVRRLGLRDQEEKVKGYIVMIVHGCILCASQMSLHQLSRYLEVSDQDLRSFDRAIDRTLTIVKLRAEGKYVVKDVFLSHSGKQKNFVRQLNRDLEREGVSCFFDESRESLPLAEKWAPLIFEAAETCRVAVLLLSMDFIQSRWPMLELSAFVKAQKYGKNSNLKILPLFFKISPGDLGDLKDLKWKDISEETRIEWKEALREVRKINGLTFKEDEDEVSFRDKIIKEIRTLLPPSPIVSMPVGSVGLEERQEKVIELLQLTSADKPRMAVVIYGFGGIGKTTLAEAVVAKIDLKHYRYARVDFNVDSSRNEIKIIQEQILNCLFQETKFTKFTSCSEGRTVLAKAFQNEGNKPIFLFIDNALRKQDLYELLPRDMKGLPKGSRILVTTRDLGATDMFVEDEAGLVRQKYLVQPLSDQEAKSFLLKGCADSNIQEDDVKTILNICRGVPLVLKIVRGHLRKQRYRADKCSQILEKLRTGEHINEEDLSKTLTDFVYDQLEESTKQSFMDICCFFYGMRPSYVEYIVGAQDLTSLEEAAFVQWSDDKKTLIVHDIIRGRGQNKAGLESTELEPTRIMNVESLIDATHQQRLKDIRGLWLVDKDEPEYVVEEQHLKAMRKLRVLALGKRMRVSHGCEATFKELRYLQVGGDIPSLPVNLERLPKLAFYKGPLFKKGFSIYKLPEKLRVLIASRQSDFNESTDLESSTSIRAVENCSLKELDLSELKNLQKLPRGLHSLTSLEILRWKGWDRMEELHEEACQLTMLTQLTLSDWSSLTCLPAGFRRLTALKNLNLRGCAALQCLPESFGELKALTSLNLYLCKALERLPESFGQLASIQNLELRWCMALQCLPESFGELKALKSLSLYRCQSLERLPESFGQLEAIENLDLRRCTALQCLPESFGELRALKSLNLSSCRALERLPESFGRLAAIKELEVRGCRALQCLPESFVELKALRSLNLSYLTALERLPESFGQLTAIEELEVAGCTALQSLPESFGELRALKSLNLSSCKALERLPESFGQLTAIEELEGEECTALQCLPESFGELKALKSLNLSSCEALERLPQSFGKLTSLGHIKMANCPARADLCLFEASLKHVIIEDKYAWEIEAG